MLMAIACNIVEYRYYERHTFFSIIVTLTIYFVANKEHIKVMHIRINIQRSSAYIFMNALKKQLRTIKNQDPQQKINYNFIKFQLRD